MKPKVLPTVKDEVKPVEANYRTGATCTTVPKEKMGSYFKVKFTQKDAQVDGTLRPTHMNYYWRNNWNGETLAGILDDDAADCGSEKVLA